MGEVVSLKPAGGLRQFFDLMYLNQEGFVYTASKSPKTESFHQYFFHWPTEKEKLIEHIVEQSHSFEVYYGPALFKAQSAEKDDVLGSNYIWCEFDGNAPKSIPDVPKPSLVIRSSEDKHQHWYWKLENFEEDVKLLEDLMQKLTYHANADFCWNANRILRPPGTIHHESGLTTSIIRESNHAVNYKQFDKLPPIPVKIIDLEDVKLIPMPIKVIAKYKFDEHMEFFLDESKQVKKGNRSDALAKLGHICVELGMTTGEALSLLLNADGRWKKFANRDPLEQKRQLLRIINFSRAKHKIEEPEDIQGTLKVFNYNDFVDADIKVDWVIKDFLPKNGLAVIFGPPSVGKTQLSVRFAEACAKGTQWLKWPIERPLKTITVSLEMPHALLAKVMRDDMKIEKSEELRERMLLAAPGYSIKILTNEGKAALEYIVNKHKPDGIIVDSWGAALADDLTSEKIIFDAVNFLRFRLMAQYGIFTWWIHHPRKGQIGNKIPNKLDDMFGSQMLAAQTDLAISVRNTGGQIEVTNPKARYGEEFLPFAIRRTPDLNFKIVETSLKKLPADTPLFGDLGDLGGSI